MATRKMVQGIPEACKQACYHLERRKEWIRSAVVQHDIGRRRHRARRSLDLSVR